MSKRDYYDVLGVTRESNTDEIERAYRKLARQYHPDRNIGDADAEHKFKEVTEAHEVLVNDEKRQRYDRYGHAGLDPNDTGFGPGGSFQDIVSDLFTAFMGGGAQRRRGQGGARRGSDRRHVVDLELHEVIAEVKKTVTLRRMELCSDCGGKGAKTGKRMTCVQCQGRGEFTQRQGFFELRQTCPRCQGEGTVIADPCSTCKGDGRVETSRDVEVKIPAGADTGLRLLLPGEGDAGQPGAERGDLEILVRVAEHSEFQRDGRHLVTAAPITFSQAALGATIDIATLTGATKLEIPRGTQSHTELRVSGEGLPELRVDRRGQPVANTRRGDLRVLVVVETPRQLDKKREELLRQLAEIEHKDVSAPRQGFLSKLKGWFAPTDDKTRRGE
jgi:molecular chaperone DnaJ